MRPRPWIRRARASRSTTSSACSGSRSSARRNRPPDRYVSRAIVTTAPDPRRWKALALVCVAFFMTVLDVSIVNVALPSIGEALDFSQENLQWVISAYAITFGGFLLLAGRAADLLGRRRVFMV